MRIHLTLRARLVVLIVAGIVPLFALSIIQAMHSADEALKQASMNLEFAASLAAASQENTAGSVRQVLTAIASLPRMQDGKNRQCDSYFASLVQRLPEYANMGIVDLDGQTRCHSLGADKKIFLGDRSYFQDAVAQRRFVVGTYAVGRLVGKPVITFSLPVIDQDDKMTGVIFASIDLTQMAKSIARLQLPPGAALGVQDRDGTLLAGRPVLPIQVGQKIASPVLREAVSTMSRGVREGPDGSGEARLWAFLPSSSQTEAALFVSVSLPRQMVVGPSLRQLRFDLSVMGLMALLGGGLAWLWGGRAIVRSTADILQATRQIQDGQLGVRIPLAGMGGSGEFFRIAAGFNRMAESLQAERCALEAELTHSQAVQEKLQDAQRLARIGYWQVGADSTEFTCSDEVPALLGLDPAVLRCTPDGLIACILPADRQDFQAARGVFLDSGVPLDVEFRVLTPVGEVRWMHIFSRSERGDAVAASGSSRSGVMQDITERKRSDLAIARMTEMLKRTGMLARVGGWELPLDTMMPFWSIETYRIHEIDPHEHVNFEAALNHYAPEVRGPFRATVRAAIETAQPWDLELPFITAKGRRCWVRTQGRALVQDGQVVGLVGALQDITLRKQSEQALIDSEQRYAALFELAPVAMWVYDSESADFLAVNKMAVDVYGYSAEEFSTMSIFDIRPLSERERLRQQLAENSFEHQLPWRHCRKDGTLLDVQMVSQSIQYEGRPARFVVGLDVTAQVSAEAKLQEHLLTLQRVANAAQAISWQRTLEGTLQEVAEQACAVVGAHQATVSLNAATGDVPPMHARAVSPQYAHFQSFSIPGQGADLYAFMDQRNVALRLTAAELQAHPAWRGAHGSPEQLPLHGWLAAPLVGRNGIKIGVLQLFDKQAGEFTQQDEYVAIELAHLASAAMENASLLEEVGQLNASLEQKVAERTAAIARQDALFRALTEQAPQMVWTADSTGRATYFNHAWFELVGGNMSDWLGSQWLALVHPEDLAEIRANWQVASAGQLQFSGERRLRAKDGCYHTMSYRASPVLGDDGQVAFWVGIDANITAIKATEAALRLSNQELEAFSYSVSHDLRAPLNTVDGFSRLLARQLSSQPLGVMAEKAQHYLSRIQAGVGQMGQLIEDLLSLAQVARAQLRSSPVNLSALARGILQDWQAAEPERVMTVSIEDALQAQGDSRLIKVVLVNLLGNAWKFSAQQVHPHISIGQLTNAAGMRVFFVRDNGVGFDMAYADKLFMPFQRLHSVAEFAGTGIGLATVSRVVERHGGRIWADAVPGFGATFFFTLPDVPQAAGMA